MWKDYIERLKEKWIGTKVQVDGNIYTIVNVDCNGVLHIDKETEHNKTTAMFLPHEVEQYII